MEPLEMPVETITPEVMEKCTTPVSDDHDEKYGVPSLEELGMFWDCLDIVQQDVIYHWKHNSFFKKTNKKKHRREGLFMVNC